MSVQVLTAVAVVAHLMLLALIGGLLNMTREAIKSTNIFRQRESLAGKLDVIVQELAALRRDVQRLEKSN